MKSYFEEVIKQLTDKHTELVNSAESVRLTDQTMFDLYNSQASMYWDRKCDAEVYLKEWERQNASDLTLVNGPIKMVSLKVFMFNDAEITFVDPDKSTIAISVPFVQGRNVYDTISALKAKAHEYLADNTEYIIPVPSQNIFNYKESVHGC